MQGRKSGIASYEILYGLGIFFKDEEKQITFLFTFILSPLHPAVA